MKRHYHLPIVLHQPIGHDLRVTLSTATNHVTNNHHQQPIIEVISSNYLARYDEKFSKTLNNNTRQQAKKLLQHLQ